MPTAIVNGKGESTMTLVELSGGWRMRGWTLASASGAHSAP
jgi:hypothetical protein